MRIAVIGATGRTGRLVVDEALRRRNTVAALVRDETKADLLPAVGIVQGDVSDAAALDRLLTGADALVSALGPRRGDGTLHRRSAPLLIAAMQAAGVRRFVGISGAGVTVPGDRKSRRDRTISAVMNRIGGDTVRDKAEEHALWAASDLEWTLVRPPRLLDRPGTGAVEHAAHTSPRRTGITRADLAAFLLRCAESDEYAHDAPLVANA